MAVVIPLLFIVLEIKRASPKCVGTKHRVFLRVLFCIQSVNQEFILLHTYYIPNNTIFLNLFSTTPLLSS